MIPQQPRLRRADAFRVFSRQSLELTEADLIGVGTRRTCYRHPACPELCIKIPKAKKNGFLQQRREIRYYRGLERRGVPTERITRYHGSVPTSLGVGYVYDAIRDHDGQVSRQFSEYLAAGDDLPQRFLRVLEVLEDYLFEHGVIIYDLSPYNILCRRSAQGELDPYIIDGVGDVVAIPVLNLSRQLVLRKVRRRWMRMIDKLARAHPWMADYRLRH